MLFPQPCIEVPTGVPVGDVPTDAAHVGFPFAVACARAVT